MFKDIEIKCHGYLFDTTDEKDANFFSGASYTGVTDIIDLKDFLLAGSSIKVKRNFNTTDRGYNGRHNLFFESSNIDFKLTDLESTSLSDYFNLYNDTRFIKYIVDIWKDGQVIWKGIIKQEGIKKTFSTGNDNEVLSVLAIGWESEFKEYFSNKELPEWSSSTYQFPFQIWQTAPGGTADWETIYGRSFMYFLSSITGQQIDYESDLGDWNISRNAFLHNKGSYKNWFIKSGYLRMWTEESIYGFMEKVCNAMGWVWYMYLLSGYDTVWGLTIKKRGGATGLSTLAIPYSDFISWSVEKNDKIVTYDYIIVLDGHFIGGNQGFPEGYSVPEVGFDHRGERMAVISDKISTENRTNHWQIIDGTAGVGDPIIGSGGYDLERRYGYKFAKYAGETDEYFNIKVHTRGTTAANSTTIGYSLPKERILFVNGGDSKNFYTGCYMDNTSNFLWEPGLVGTPMTDAMLLWKGNHGSMMFQQSGYDLINYQTYTQTDEFANNFRPFLDSRKNQKVTIRVKQVITDPLQYVTVSGTTKEPFKIRGNKWAIVGMETDLLNDITELNLASE